MQEIAEKRPSRKSISRALAVESTLPGLLALARWAPRRLSIEHFALACDTSYTQAMRQLQKLRAKSLVTAIKTVRPFGTGQGMLMHGLTQKGHEMFADSYEWEGEHTKPSPRVPHGPKFAHDHMTLAALISAEREIDANPDYSVVSRFAEFKWDTRKGGLGKFPTSGYLADKETRVKWDASLTISRNSDGAANPFLIETDMGSEQITPVYADRDNSITTKFKRLWKYLHEGDFDQNLGANQDRFKVAFITTTHRRIDSIIKRVPWDSFTSDAGLFPKDVFLFATHEEAIGRQKSATDTVKGSFWNGVWRSCDGHECLSLIKAKAPSPTLRVVDGHGT